MRIEIKVRSVARFITLYALIPFYVVAMVSAIFMWNTPVDLGPPSLRLLVGFGILFIVLTICALVVGAIALMGKAIEDDKSISIGWKKSKPKPKPIPKATATKL